MLDLGMRVPHFSRPLREVGTTTLGILIFQLGASEQGGKTVRLGRTPLSEAFDVGVGPAATKPELRLLATAPRRYKCRPTTPSIGVLPICVMSWF